MEGAHLGRLAGRRAGSRPGDLRCEVGSVRRRWRDHERLDDTPVTALETAHVESGQDLVVLLEDDGTPAGTAPRLSVHGTETPLHQAFSLHLFDDQGRVLLTRRALSKLTWPGVWTNSCCGHPRPGEALEDAVRRRLREELGVEVDDLRIVLPDFRYRAVDASGVVENEICPHTRRLQPVVGAAGAAARCPPIPPPPA
ncbi:MAG: isopentenyl-diphosphate Delta-isomerase [Actinomycetales bacterium]|nr:MAG: isopentenyl-diphosphate Delta-isomerase [Actinomycetales bacterium]